MRVFELAKKIGLPSKELLVLLKKNGVKVSNHMSAIADHEAQAILDKKEKKDEKPRRKVLSRKSKPARAAKPSPPPPPPKKTRVLIKRKPVPEEPLPAAVKISQGQKETALPEQPPPISAESTPAIAVPTQPEGLVPPGSQREEKPPLSVPSETAPLPFSETQVEAPSETQKIEEQEKADKEKKKGKRPLQKETKGDFHGKVKDKSKRNRKIEWELPERDLTTPPLSETTKWQDFKPIHRKDDRRAHRKGGGGAVVDVSKPRKKDIKIYAGLTVKEFAELIGQKVPSIIAKLMELGKMSTVNQPIGLDEASLIAESFGVKTETVSEKTEEEILEQYVSDDPSMLLPRPPVITIMGHVDHGKTSLLDAIRQTKVTEGEAGGITQHIGAYTVSVDKKKVAFLDTPGHEAFTAMRARGAKITDIVILVVAADDGVMPQTIEAINHSKAANVPIIVAINKIDKPEANLERVKNVLSEFELIPEEWGGKTIFAEVSAKQNIGLENLLEMILLQAEVLELKANPNKPAVGTIVEAKIDKGRGPVATVLVQEGTLRVGDIFVTGVHFGKVRALINDEGEKVSEAGPSTPVEVIGLDGVPLSGDTFVVVPEERIAKDVASSRSQRQRVIQLS
ncbi:MAG: translation initiation factor IF-2, partial [Nitrospiria bacterium]